MSDESFTLLQVFFCYNFQVYMSAGDHSLGSRFSKWDSLHSVLHNMHLVSTVYVGIIQHAYILLVIIHRYVLYVLGLFVYSIFK